MSRATTLRRTSLFASVTALAWAGAAAAQSGTPATDPSAEDVSSQAPVEQAQADDSDTIVVTGSRVSSGFTTPTPVTVATSETLQAAAPANLADGLNQLPSFRGSARTSQATSGSVNGTVGQNLLNLRGLGPQRNLILLDGQRLVASNANGSFDVNLIPQNLVQRVEVVTGGASAVYGSDAVAGVVNFILDTNFTGLELEAQAGISTYGDAGSTKVSAAFGTQFAGGRGRFIASAEYFRSSAITAYDTGGRGWLDEPAGQIPNPVTGATPRRLVFSDVVSSIAAPGGLITSGPLRGTAFGPGGTPFAFDFGSFTGTTFQVGGDGTSALVGLSPRQRRLTGFGHFEFDITPQITFYAEGL